MKKKIFGLDMYAKFKCSILCLYVYVAFSKTYAIYIIMPFLQLYLFRQLQKRHICKKLKVMATIVQLMICVHLA